MQDPRAVCLEPASLVFPVRRRDQGSSHLLGNVETIKPEKKSLPGLELYSRTIDRLATKCHAVFGSFRSGDCTYPRDPGHPMEKPDPYGEWVLLGRIRMQGKNLLR